VKSNIPVFVLVVILFSCKGKSNQAFRLLTPEQTNISFSNEVHETDSINVLDYFYIYNGAGVAVGDVNNDGLVSCQETIVG
jgi:enediyne biosynthesis protein E4